MSDGGRMGECEVMTSLSIMDGRIRWIELGSGGLVDVDNGHGGEMGSQLCRGVTKFW